MVQVSKETEKPSEPSVKADDAHRDKGVSVSDLYNYSMKELTPEDYRGSEIYKHFTTVFDMQGKKLIFVGGLHTRGYSEYIGFITELIDKVKPQIVLIERPNDYTKAQLEEYMNQVPKSSWNETYWTIEAAKKRGIDFAGMDISDSKVLDSFIGSQKDGMELGIMFWTLLGYYGVKGKYIKMSSAERLALAKRYTISDFTVPGMPLYGLHDNFLEACKKYDSTSVNKAVDKIVADMIFKYTGRELSTEFMDSVQLTAPYPFVKGYELSKISALWHATRDKAMIDSCIAALKNHSCVVAIAGTGHIMEMHGVLERELKSEFGEVRTKRWDELHG